ARDPNCYGTDAPTGYSTGEDQSAGNGLPRQCRLRVPAPRGAARRAGGHALAAPAGTRAAGLHARVAGRTSRTRPAAGTLPRPSGSAPPGGWAVRRARRTAVAGDPGRKGAAG